MLKEYIPIGVTLQLYNFLQEASLTLPPTPVTIYYTKSLTEFHYLTDMPYNIGGIYENFQIIFQPREILVKKKIFEKVLLHELLHWVLYGLSEKYQEGLIYWYMGYYEKKEVDIFLNKFADFNYELPLFISYYWEK
ncbi:hypothetical protein JYK00_07360 [Thermosipho ferrireducens]|uniref:Uncharacterized protein n=2 Tax=Thermosipho ferrireducens TaxID=2571116 RepID=A0ABX7S8L6_9BACT|nr:hypothetical protein JYK00_07360 [Thermosipho ferrireducens]